MNSRTNSKITSLTKTRLLPYLALQATLAVGPALVLVGSFSGCAGTATRPSTGEAIDDGVVTTRVKTALLRDDDTPGTAIKVETFRGTVQLSGFVNTLAQKNRAAEIARGVPGVQTVVNDIVVK
jgi:osmotically-inducible protein OsmY